MARQAALLRLTNQRLAEERRSSEEQWQASANVQWFLSPMKPGKAIVQAQSQAQRYAEEVAQRAKGALQDRARAAEAAMSALAARTQELAGEARHETESRLALE